MNEVKEKTWREARLNRQREKEKRKSKKLEKKEKGFPIVKKLKSKIR